MINVLLCGCETWTFGKEEKDRITVFKIYVWGRKNERIKWVDGVTNEEVLKE